MSVSVSTLILFCTLSSSLAASAYGPATVHQSNPNMCYASEGEKYFLPGESWQLGGCSVATCGWSNYSGSAQLIVAYESCGVVAADPPCYISEDSDLAYPDCCPQAICPEGEGDEEGKDDKTTEVMMEKDEQVKSDHTDHEAPESDSDNEVEVEMNVGPAHDYYDLDQLDQSPETVSDKFLYRSHHEHDNHQDDVDDDSENMIETSVDMGVFGLPHFQDQELQGQSDQKLEYFGRKVSPKFQYVESMYPKFGYHWIY